MGKHTLMQHGIHNLYRKRYHRRKVPNTRTFDGISQGTLNYGRLFPQRESTEPSRHMDDHTEEHILDVDRKHKAEELLEGIDEKLYRWAEYFEEVLNEDKKVGNHQENNIKIR